MNHQLVLSRTNAGFSLQTAPALTGPFTNLPAATSPYTNPSPPRNNASGPSETDVKARPERDCVEDQSQHGRIPLPHTANHLASALSLGTTG